MRRQWKTALALAAAAALLLAGCSKSVQESDVAGKIYQYEKEGFGGDFVIRVEEDNVFSYYEGGLSSYIGFGEWELDGDTLLLHETRFDTPAVQRFKADGDALVYQAEGSAGFLYVKVADGDRFPVSAVLEPGEHILDPTPADRPQPTPQGK